MIHDKNNNSNQISKYLLWLDMEMSGLNVETEVVLEVAIVITDNQLNIIDQLDSIVIKQPEHVLTAMDSWNQAVHAKSGLIGKVQNSTISIATADTMVAEFLKPYFKPNQAILCGNTVYQDRKFINKYLPQLENFLHYRLLDVSTIKEIVKRWYSDLPKFEKHSKHEALADIQESIEELKYYRTHIMKSI